MFTDKAKNKFKIWYNEFILDKFKDHHIQDIQGYPQFINLPLSMKWGVIEDFADDLSYDLDVMQWISKENNHYESTIRYVNDSDMFIEKKHKTRDEARLECIKVLNELLNK